MSTQERYQKLVGIVRQHRPEATESECREYILRALIAEGAKIK